MTRPGAGTLPITIDAFYVAARCHLFKVSRMVYPDSNEILLGVFRSIIFCHFG